MKRLTVVVAYLSLFWLITAKAGIMANMTRVIYHQGDKERSVLLANTNSYPVIVQNWVDHGEADPQAETPFVVLASVFHLAAQKIQAIRIIYNGDPLPDDRESVFWLNLYEIPPNLHDQALKQDNPKVSLAMNTQLKLFYRPTKLADFPAKLADKITFKLLQKGQEWVLVCKNPLPFHISFSQIFFESPHKRYWIKQQMDMMIPPFSERIYPFEQPISQQAGRIVFSYLNDAGFSVREVTTFQTP
ncbi:molecular chaperone [Arsenophonus apicola]|jgi:P pilus assembly chaperone PapD|uniref:fimbrial biogenesis chaperone n=1 Tax=Arsenophonus apicola TaxID=2879119 RepID=UPI003878FB27